MVPWDQRRLDKQTYWIDTGTRRRNSQCWEYKVWTFDYNDGYGPLCENTKMRMYPEHEVEPLVDALRSTLDELKAYFKDDQKTPNRCIGNALYTVIEALDKHKERTSK